MPDQNTMTIDGTTYHFIANSQPNCPGCVAWGENCQEPLCAKLPCSPGNLYFPDQKKRAAQQQKFLTKAKEIGFLVVNDKLPYPCRSPKRKDGRRGIWRKE